MRLKRRRKINKVGIFGGSFNPIHNGHIEIISSAIKDLNLDKIYIVPVGKPSHKEEVEMASKEDRYKMVQLALGKMEKVIVSRIEIDKKKTSYTYDTLKDIKRREKNSKIFEIIGEDSAYYLEKWKNYRKMKKMCIFAYVARKGKKIQGENLLKIEMPLYKVSSTEIRKKIVEKGKIEGLVPKSVEDYIRIKKLYRKEG